MQIALSLQTWLARSIADLGNNLCQGTTKPSTCQTFIIIANLLKDYRNEGYALIQRMGFIIDSTPLLWRRRTQRENTSSAEIKLTVSFVSGAAIQRTIPSDKQTIKKKKALLTLLHQQFFRYPLPAMEFKPSDPIFGPKRLALYIHLQSWVSEVHFQK